MAINYASSARIARLATPGADSRLGISFAWLMLALISALATIPVAAQTAQPCPPLSYTSNNEPAITPPLTITYPAQGNASVAGQGSNMSTVGYTVNVVHVSGATGVYFGVNDSDTNEGVPWDDAGGVLTDGFVKAWAIDVGSTSTFKITITFNAPVTGLKFAVTDLDFVQETAQVDAFSVAVGGSVIQLTDHLLSNPSAYLPLAQGTAHAGNDAYVVDQTKVQAAGSGLYKALVSGDLSNQRGTVLFAYGDAQPVQRIEITYTGSNTGIWIAGMTFNNTCPIPIAVWVPVASHNPGLNQSQWRSDLGLLNTGAVTANVQLSFYGSGGVVTNTVYVPAGAQSILTDVVGQLGGSGSGAIGVVSGQSLKVTARSYNQVSSSATCYPNGTQGQDYPAVSTSAGLGAGQSAYLAGLTENASYRCNIGLANTGTGNATVLVELFNGAGTKLTDYTVSPLAAGQWAQDTQPFKNRAGQTAMDRGYAKITVQSGSGVFGFASVIDNITNDPTTVAMQQ